MNKYYLINGGELQILITDKLLEDVIVTYDRVATQDEIDQYISDQNIAEVEQQQSIQRSFVRVSDKVEFTTELDLYLDTLSGDNVTETEVLSFVSEYFDDKQVETLNNFYEDFCDLLSGRSLDDSFTELQKESFVANFFGLSSYDYIPLSGN